MKKYNQKIVDLIQKLSEKRKKQDKYGTKNPMYLVQRKKVDELYAWETVAYFLTEEDAKEYQQYQKHNLGVSRLYVVTTGYGNRGILSKLLHLLDTEDFILKTEE